MPQEQQYAATDPKTNLVAFLYENKDALKSMKPERADKLLQVAFRKHLLPKYLRVNSDNLTFEQQKALFESFKARMYGVSGAEQTPDMGDEKKSGKLAKAGAALVGGGAGVLGGIRGISELVARLDKTDLSKDPIHQAVSRAEGKAYDEASALDPKVASVSAGVGHQIPAALAAEGAGSLFPKLASGASAVSKIATGGAKGATEGAAYESARPGGDPKSGAMWGGVLGAAFPAIGKILGLGRGTAAATGKEAVSSVGSSTGAASSVPKGEMKDLPNIVAQKHFGKAFKDLSPAERTQMPDKLKSEIASQRSAAREGKKAASEAMKKAVEDEKVAKRAEKAKAATSKAEGEAKKRSEGVSQATAQAAAAQNPQAAKAAATFTPEVKPNEPTVTKVPEGKRGVQKAGSPAKQAADRERIAKKREEASREQINQSLEQHARELAGRHTPASLNLMHLPEMEEAIQELPGGKEVLDGARKAKKTYKMSDEIYMETLKEWMLDQFSQQP